MKTKWHKAITMILGLALCFYQRAVAAPNAPPAQNAPQKNTSTRAVVRSVQTLPAPGVASLKSSLVLCEIVQCGTPAPPTVTQVNKMAVDPAQPAIVSPLLNVVVNGENFNDKNGNFGTLVLMLKPPNFLSPHEFVLQNMQWSDKAAIGQVPQIIGFVDQPASLQVRRPDGVWSAPVPVQFYAERDVKWLGSGNVPGQGITCSNSADQNQCNSWSDFGATGPPADLGNGSNNLALFGVHNSFLGTETGVDQFHVLLKNGWTYKDRYGPTIGTKSCEAADPAAARAVFTKISPAEFAFAVQWTSVCQFDYGIWVSIEGPIGVPPN